MATYTNVCCECGTEFNVRAGRCPECGNLDYDTVDAAGIAELNASYGGGLDSDV